MVLENGAAPFKNGYSIFKLEDGAASFKNGASLKMEPNTYNVSDSSDTDSHDYLDLASTNIIQYRTRGQKQRQKANERADANRCSVYIEYIKPNTRVKTQRQKVPDDEDIDMDKIVKDKKPGYARK